MDGRLQEPRGWGDKSNWAGSSECTALPSTTVGPMGAHLPQHGLSYGPEEEVTFLPLLPLAIGVDNMHLCVLAGYQCLTLDHSLRDVTLKPESLAALSLPQMIL